MAGWGRVAAVLRSVLRSYQSVRSLALRRAVGPGVFGCVIGTGVICYHHYHADNRSLPFAVHAEEQKVSNVPHRTNVSVVETDLRQVDTFSHVVLSWYKVMWSKIKVTVTHWNEFLQKRRNVRLDSLIRVRTNANAPQLSLDGTTLCRVKSVRLQSGAQWVLSRFSGSQRCFCHLCCSRKPQLLSGLPEGFASSSSPRWCTNRSPTWPRETSCTLSCWRTLTVSCSHVHSTVSIYRWFESSIDNQQMNLRLEALSWLIKTDWNSRRANDRPG